MVRLNKIYTRTGDDGSTGLIGGERVGKDDLRIEAYGTVDELNAALGVLHVPLDTGGSRTATLLPKLLGIEQSLFDLGASLAARPASRWPGMPTVTQADVDWLERDIDAMNTELQPLQSFVLPGGGAAVAQCHVARTVCRRAEREALRLSRQEPVDPVEIKYLNRLSDWLFVAGRWVGHRLGEAEVLWQPGRRSE